MASSPPSPPSMTTSDREKLENAESRRSSSSAGTPPPPTKSPTIFIWDPCLSKCCFNFHHKKGVLAYAAVGTVLNLAAIGLFLAFFHTDILSQFGGGANSNPFSMVYLVVAATSVAGAAFHALLLFAVWKRRRWLIPIYLLYATVAAVGILTFLLLGVIWVMFDGEVEVTIFMFAVNIILPAIGAVCLLYFWCVVWSLFIRMGDPHDPINV